jgi:hypothetical protein
VPPKDILTRWSGPTYDDLLRQARVLGDQYYGPYQALCSKPLIDVLCDLYESRPDREREAQGKAETLGQKKARERIASVIESAFADVNLGFSHLRGPHHPIAENPGAAVRLRLAGPPTTSSGGVSLRVCASTQIANGVDPDVIGSVGAGASPPVSPMPSGDSNIELDVNGNTLNHVLYFLWQSGALRDIGTSKNFVQAMFDRTREPDGSQSALQKLAFEFKGLDPGLPPTIMPGTSGSDGLKIALGDVRIGNWDTRRVVAHALGALAIEPTGGDLKLKGSVTEIAANCTGTGSNGSVLSPCMSDLMPAIRPLLVNKPLSVAVHGGDVLARLPTMSFGGGQVQLSDLEATTSANPVRLTLQVSAQVLGDAP